MEVSDCGKVTVVKALQSSKASSPIVISAQFSGKVIVSKDSQYLKAVFSMVVSAQFSGKVTEIKALHS